MTILKQSTISNFILLWNATFKVSLHFFFFLQHCQNVWFSKPAVLDDCAWNHSCHCYLINTTLYVKAHRRDFLNEIPILICRDLSPCSGSYHLGNINTAALNRPPNKKIKTKTPNSSVHYTMLIPKYTIICSFSLSHSNVAPLAEGCKVSRVLIKHLT